MPKITVKYGAFSNISYKGSHTFEFNDADWADMSQEERRDTVQDEFEQFLRDDISYEIQNADEYGV